MENLQDKILNLVRSICLKKEEIQAIEGTSPDVEFLLMESLKLEENKRYGECVDTLQVVLDVTWEELNTGHWSLVPDFQRAIYSVTSLLKVIALAQQAITSSDDCQTSLLQQAIKTADMGLLLGISHREQLTKAAKILSEAVTQFQLPVSGARTSKDRNTPELKVPAVEIPILHSPSLETFSSQHFYPRKPVKISGCMTHWPALRLWEDLQYLLTVAGSRTVPVELGSNYAQSDWSQRLMTLREFISLYITNPTSDSKDIGYLAQHQLFDQVPELRKDIFVPDYCACSEEEGEVDINAWFGPPGTLSPLHHDPKHNLLCQVVGHKRVVLYSPSDTDCLYPHEGRLLSNTARVDPEAPDYKLYPKYRNTQAITCQLNPGDMLYIPPTWWHHVRALDLSFSVSFWWT
ncbi:bifunctional peptidase and arginyl-hydroxylase JMJD5-like [Macrosteles quadrilineatus]|uniref:bifunctional peptidase and arginyl-hydroxylase JMJD5-like n=1 Tax=Macrosteles quadrilineatus TaxID=74068 RepID=UPI0023E0C0E8|nr:bifunctional peptidase and arginyl-hydroxylase JMJD5-like [Macrosteles quadrilineatus]